MTSRLAAWFWDDEFWLPTGVNWTALASTPEVRFPAAAEMLLPIPLALLFCAARSLFELFVARPLGRALGIPDSPQPSFLLLRSGSALHRRLRSLAGVCDPPDPDPKGRPDCNGNISPAKKYTGPPKYKLDKFAECCYRFTYYASIFAFGACILYNKPWTWRTAGCWEGYPRQPLEASIWWYYILQSGFYWGLIFSQYQDVRRKDFAMNLVHHIVTVGLLWWSWVANFVRIGALVMCVHDMCDPWLEGAKLAKYAGANRAANVAFAIFTGVWFLSRLYLYPFFVLHSTAVEAPAIIGHFRSYYLFNGLLLVLQVLHILWSLLIVKALRAAWQKEGHLKNMEDCRSDSEEDDEPMKKRN